MLGEENKASQEGKDKRPLVGYLYSFRNEDWKNIRKAVIEGCDVLYGLDDRRHYPPSNSLKDKYSSRFRSLISLAEEHSSARAEFVLDRTGEFELHSLELKRDFGAEPSESNGSSGISPANIKYLVASQHFYFMRDITHNHQHHDRFSDQLTILFPHDAEEPLKWLRQSYSHLMRHIIGKKRVAGAGRFEAILGLLSYARTLRTLLKEKDKTSYAHCDPAHDIDNLERSIRAKADEQRTTFSELISNSSYRLSRVCFIVALFMLNMAILNLSAAQRNSFDTVGVYQWILREFSQHPRISNLLILMVISAYFGLHKPDRLNDWITTRIARLAVAKYGMILIATSILLLALPGLLGFWLLFSFLF